MPCLREIADHIGVSKGRAGQLKQLGMPVNSLRAAKMWRTRQPLRRAPTNAKGSCKLAVVERIPRRKFFTILKPSNTGDSLLDVLNNCFTVANCAFEEYDHARLNNWPTVSARISDHSRALMAYIKMERLYRQELERRGVLVNRHEIVGHCRRCLDAVLKRLKRLPQETGPQINPQQPVMAYEILQRAVNEILLAGQNALRDLEAPEDQ